MSAKLPPLIGKLPAHYAERAQEKVTVDRRDFMRLMGASLGLAGASIAGCTRQPLETIVPRARTPEDTVPGRPQWFATAMAMPGAGGAALGLLVESHEGRPTKIEGNPLHPSSLGGTDVFAQAAVLDIYDPDRAKVVTRAGRISSYSGLVTALQPQLDRLKAAGGEGLRILSPPVVSPTLARQRAAVAELFPKARWHQWTPTHRDTERAGAILAFGRDVSLSHHLDKADVILSLDGTLLDDGAGWVRHARDFADRRRVRPTGGKRSMNRLYAVESVPSLTGANADHRLAMSPQQVESFARGLGAALGVSGLGTPALSAAQKKFLAAVAADLKAAGPRALVLTGRHSPPAVHALTHMINHRLGAFGTTLHAIEPLHAFAEDQSESIRDLVTDMKSGTVELLLILEGNPAYDAPADLDFAGACSKVKVRVRLGLHEDETSAVCQWHVPATHFLESWSDALAHDGTASIVQPLIAPLYNGRSAHQLIAFIEGRPAVSAHDLVRETWTERLGADGFEARWRTALHDGLIAGTERSPLNLAAVAQSAAALPAPGSSGSAYVAAFRPDPTIWDGRAANNGWLQELPKVQTRLTWDNAVELSPADADQEGLENGDVVKVTVDGRTIEGPIWRSPGLAKGTVVLRFGYGRRRGGKLAREAGHDVYPLRTRSDPWTATGVRLAKTGRSVKLSTTQEHGSMEGRPLIHTLALSEVDKGIGGHGGAGEEAGHGGGHPTLYPAHKYEGNAWAMVIDLAACIGCNACTIACQAENNIPIVGREEVALGREMHWIRVDRYFDSASDGGARHQPIPCMHCENAPCEVVCPVNATVHNAEGLNEMTYNRCVGTRYCANNCPYKVRRFNFYLYQDWETESLKLQRNPDVTVRSRGVMEKCTYCVQRINGARIDAKVAGRPLKDGDIVVACQQACPVQAIRFGDKNDPKSVVADLRGQPHHYGLLEELNTVPRTTYLAEVRNPSPALSGGKG